MDNCLLSKFVLLLLQMVQEDRCFLLTKNCLECEDNFVCY